MGREPITKQLGELTFRVMPFGGRKGYELGLEVLEAVGPGLAMGIGALGGMDAEVPEGLEDAAGMLDGMDFGQMAGAIEKVFSRLPKAERWPLTMSILGGVEVQKDQALADAMGGPGAKAGEPGWMALSEAVFDMVFAQNIGPVFHLIALVVEVNWKGPLASYLGSLSAG